MRDDWDQFTWAGDFEAIVTRMFAEAFAASQADVDRWLITGNGTGEPRGILSMAGEWEPSPLERALAILDPHLRACPLYAAGAPVLYPATWKAQP